METEKQDKVEKEIDRAEVKEQPKKPYTTPHLTIFGRVEEFTECLIDYGACPT